MVKSVMWSILLWSQVGSYIIQVFRYMAYMVNLCWSKPWTVYPICTVLIKKYLSDRNGIGRVQEE